VAASLTAWIKFDVWILAEAEAMADFGTAMTKIVVFA
jgi:hypothetical protein